MTTSIMNWCTLRVGFHFFFQFYFLLFYPIVSQNLCIGKVQGPTSTGDMHNEYFKTIFERSHKPPNY